jgi:hypothetical protein
MDPTNRELRNHLDPTALRILKKRLVSGKITPQVFKDILKRQMVKYFFESYRHPLVNTWNNYWRSSSNRMREHGSAKPRLQTERFEVHEHKRF